MRENQVSIMVEAAVENNVKLHSKSNLQCPTGSPTGQDSQGLHPFSRNTCRQFPWTPNWGLWLYIMRRRQLYLMLSAEMETSCLYHVSALYAFII